MSKPVPAFLFLSLATLVLLVGQTPKGYAVVACFKPGSPNPNAGQPGGLFLVHPRNPGLPLTVGGLGPQLTGQGTPTGVGANSIVALPDGDLLVGEIWSPGGPGTTLDVHKIRLTLTANGWSGTVVRSYPIGTFVGQDAQITDLELLPGGDVLVALDGVLAAPMAGVELARLKLATGSVAALLVNSNLYINALAMSANGQVAYLGQWISQGAGNVWAFPMPNGPATFIAAVPSGVMAMDRDNQGQLVVGTFGGSPPPGLPPNLFRVNPATGSVVTMLPGVKGVRNGVLTERNTGDFFVVRSGDIAYVSGGVQTMLVTGANWGATAGLAMVPAADSYGSQTGGAAAYEWQTAPNPGGLPLLGSRTFSVTMDTTAIPTVSLVAFSASPMVPSMAVPPWTAWIDPAQIFGGFILPGSAPFTVPLPIPNDMAFQGFPFYAQTIHLDASGPVSSPGLCVTIL